MVTAHTGMNISRGEFTHVIDDILGVLEKQIDEESKKRCSCNSMVPSL
jgi:hemoglobin